MANIIFRVTGGICPGNYRSTSISLECKDIQEGYEKASIWAKKNFPDWNHIDTLFNGNEKALIMDVKVDMPVPVYVRGRKISKKK